MHRPPPVWSAVRALSSPAGRASETAREARPDFIAVSSVQFGSRFSRPARLLPPARPPAFLAESTVFSFPTSGRYRPAGENPGPGVGRFQVRQLPSDRPRPPADRPTVCRFSLCECDQPALRLLYALYGNGVGALRPRRPCLASFLPGQPARPPCPCLSSSSRTGPAYRSPWHRHRTPPPPRTERTPGRPPYRSLVRLYRLLLLCGGSPLLYSESQRGVQFTHTEALGNPTGCFLTIHIHKNELNKKS